MFESCEILPFLVKFRSHDMLDGGRAREAELDLHLSSPFQQLHLLLSFNLTIFLGGHLLH